MSERSHWARVVVVSTVSPPPGGIATHSDDIVRQLRRDGVATTTIAPQSKVSDRVVPDDTVREVISPRGVRQRHYSSLLEELRPDAVIVQFSIPLYHSSILAVIALMKAARTRGVPVLTLFHEPVRELRMLGPLGRFIYRAVLRHTSIPVALSDVGADALRTVAPSAHELFLGVVPLDPPTPADLERAASLMGTSGPVVTMLGFIHPHKGTHFVLEAANELIDELPKDAIVLVAGSRKDRHGLLLLMARGDRRYEQRLHHLAARQWPPGRVRFIPYVANDLLPAVLARSSVVVLPYGDTTQSAVASLCVGARRPVVASNVAGLRSLDGAALYCDPTDRRQLARTVTRVISDPTLQRELSSAADALIEQQSFARLTTSLEQLWWTVVEAPRGN